MTMESPREVQIGGETYHIARFRGLKASIAGALMSRVMREVPQIQDRVSEFRKQFKESNSLTLTPAMAKLPRFEMLGLTTEDFAAAGGNIELPEEPDQGTILVNVFPDLFELAQKELQRFLALIIIPNPELESADDADNVDEVLTRWGKKLMREGDLDELLELMVIGSEVLKEQMASKRDRLGKIPIPWLQQILNPPEEEEPKELEETELPSNGHGQTSPTPTETSPSPLASSPLPSSSDSQPVSVGTEEQLSTESPGTS